MERAARLTAVVTHEGGWYVARALEVEVASQGPSVEESPANLREALELGYGHTLASILRQAGMDAEELRALLYPDWYFLLAVPRDRRAFF